MFGRRLPRSAIVILFLLVGAILRPQAGDWSGLAWAGQWSTNAMMEDGDEKPEKKRTKKRSSKKKSTRSKKKKKSKEHIRWGQRPNESDEKYDKRYGRVLKRVKKDEAGDFRGGIFQNAEGEEIRLWTHMGHPFIIRSDISQEFTADTVMYMEMLHREFSQAYNKLLGKAAQVKEPVEIIVFGDRGTYMRAGGQPNSGGQFDPIPYVRGEFNRGASWPARHGRMMQFTDGIDDFSKWPKGVLKHESCHMELHLRLGYKLEPRLGIGVPVGCPIWWNEGQASVFEHWDFNKTVDENFEEIPTRGRYAPFIRRIYGTDDWKGFDYYWTINPMIWNAEGRVYLNYCQSWSFVAYMFTGGKKGMRDFRTIFDLSTRVGTNDPDINFADRQVDFSRAWAEKFPARMQAEMENNWKEWVEKNVPKNAKTPDEEFAIRAQGYDPSVIDRLQRITGEEEQKKNQKWIEKERRKRKKVTVVEW